MSYYETDILGQEVDILGEDFDDLLMGEDDIDAILGEDDMDDFDDDDMLGFSLKKLVRSAAMPHTLVTDRLPRRVQAALDPAGAMTRGRRKRAKRKAARVMRNALAAKVARAGAVVQSSPPTRARRLILPIVSAADVAGGASTTISVAPVEPFRAESFVVDAVVAPSFTVDDIKVGRKSQFLGSGGAAATIFQPNSQLSLVKFDTGQISQDIAVTVSNITGAAARFRATLIGTAVGN